MTPVINLFLRFETFTTRLALWLAMFFLVTATALAVYQVSARFIFGHPSTWSEVIARSAMIWGVFMGVAPTVREGAMIAVDVVQRALPPKLGLALHLVAALLTLFFFAVLFWQGWAMTERVINQNVAALDLSMSWAYSALPTGSVFIMLAILGSVIRALRGDWIGRPEAAL